MNVHMLILQWHWGRFHYWQHASHMARNLLLNTWRIMWTCLHSSFQTNQFLAFCLRNQWILKIACIVGGFNPSEKTLVKLDHLSRYNRGNSKNPWKPPPSWIWNVGYQLLLPFSFPLNFFVDISRGADFILSLHMLLLGTCNVTGSTLINQSLSCEAPSKITRQFVLCLQETSNLVFAS